MNQLRALIFPVALTLTIPACGDGTGPVNLTGSYHATRFILIRTGSPAADVLAAGGSMTVVLAEDGTVAGNIFVPRSLTDDPQDYQLTLLGSYSRNDRVIRIQDDQSESFVEDVDWIIGINTLTATFSDVDADIQVTLTKDPANP